MVAAGVENVSMQSTFFAPLPAGQVLSPSATVQRTADHLGYLVPPPSLAASLERDFS